MLVSNSDERFVLESQSHLNSQLNFPCVARNSIAASFHPLTETKRQAEPSQGQERAGDSQHLESMADDEIDSLLEAGIRAAVQVSLATRGWGRRVLARRRLVG